MKSWSFWTQCCAKPDIPASCQPSPLQATPSRFHNKRDTSTARNSSTDDTLLPFRICLPLKISAGEFLHPNETCKAASGCCCFADVHAYIRTDRFYSLQSADARLPSRWRKYLLCLRHQ